MKTEIMNARGNIVLFKNKAHESRAEESVKSVDSM